MKKRSTSNRRQRVRKKLLDERMRAEAIKNYPLDSLLGDIFADLAGRQETLPADIQQILNEKRERLYEE